MPSSLHALKVLYGCDSNQHSRKWYMMILTALVSYLG